MREAWERSGRSFVVLAGLEWAILMEAFDEVAKRIPAERYLELRYEDLVKDPRGTWPEILELAGLAWTDAFEDAFRAYPVATSRREAFRRDLSPAQVGQLEEAIGPWLEARGYGLGGSEAAE
jgi:hypothetical protein